MINIDKIISSVLNLSSSDIDSIQSVCDSENQLSLFIRIKKRTHHCPICDDTDIISNGHYKRTIKVPVSILNNAKIILKVRRYRCQNCNHTFNESLHLTPAYKTISYSSIMKIMDLLKSPNITFKNVSELVGISESSVIRIFDQHCHITRGSFPEVLCMDEVYTRNSTYDSKFSCVLYDFFNKTIIDVTPSRRKNYLHYYFQKIPLSERNRVKYVCIDMYIPYRQIISIYFKKAIICVDSFHVIKHLNDDLHKIRIRIMKQFNTDSIEYYLLKHWKNLLFDRQIDLDNPGKYNKKLKRVVTYGQLLEMILDIHQDLRNGYYLKERYTIFNTVSTFDQAKENIDALIGEFVRADIYEYQEFTSLLINWKQEIVNSFIVYKGKRINNSIAEGINAQISVILFNTKGIKNDERRRKRIMYAINKTGFTIK